jgi:hypothetical protein
MMSTGSCSTKRLLHLLCVARFMQCNVMQDVVVVDYLKHGLELLLPPHHSGVKTKIGHSTVLYSTFSRCFSTIITGRSESHTVSVSVSDRVLPRNYIISYYTR